MNQALTLPGIGDLVDGRFRIDRKLGEGGTSTVYEVSHVITDKKFAIKWLLPELALEDAAVDRFIHEARVGGKFAHSHAVQVYDICKASDSFYMLMELLEGESVQTRLEREGQLSVQEACSIVLTCADVLSAAHRMGIIHRDLKPANIFLCQDGDNPEVTKLLDFGISTFCSDLKSLSLTATPSGSVIGTPLYMSPEQMLGADIDARADIYALGAVLYELVSGQPPFQADNYGELVVKVTVECRPTPLEEMAPVDKQFAAIVARAMARRADDRFSTVEELIFALRPYAPAVDTSTVRAIGSGRPEPSQVRFVTAPYERGDRRDQSGRATGVFERASLRFGRTRVLTSVFSGLALVGGAVVVLVMPGAPWLARGGHTLSASAPRTAAATPDSVPSPPDPLAIAPEGALLPSGESGWGRRPTTTELLTGRAAPNAIAPAIAPNKPARNGSGASARRDRDRDRDKPRAKGAAEASSPAPTNADPPRNPPRSSASHKRDPDLSDMHEEAGDEAPTRLIEAPTKSALSTNLQLHRADFQAKPAATSNAPPKASVSRTDF